MGITALTRTARGGGGRGIIWSNHIALNLGYPELENLVLNVDRDGMDDWTYLLTKYKNAPFVCAGFDKAEQEKAKKVTPDAMGGIGYNVYPLLAAVNGKTDANVVGGWGNPSSGPISLSAITHTSSRCMYASSYDWHLSGEDRRAYDRFGKNKAAMAFWDGSSRMVTKTEFDRAIETPDKH